MPQTQQEIEMAIGYAPIASSEAALNNSMYGAQKATLRSQLISWIILNGIPARPAATALDKSLILSYCHRSYLLNWRQRINPSFALLGGEEDTTATTLIQEAPKPTTSDPTSSSENTGLTKAQTEAWLKDLFAQVERAVEEKVAKTTLKLDDGAKDQIKLLARDSARQCVEELMPPRQFEIVDHAKGSIIALGLQHERFPTLLRAVQARDHRGFRLNIWLTGPTGSGKTTAAEAVSKALALPFGSDGSLDADYKVLGFRDANGNIISTQFLEIYEGGGVYVADEIDNWLPSALLSLNAALANGWVASPKGLIKRHPDTCVIACANTWGLGATSDYVGRTRLDAASLDRFHPKINWPIDERLERAVAQNMAGELGTDWHDVVLKSPKGRPHTGPKDYHLAPRNLQRHRFATSRLRTRRSRRNDACSGPK